MQRGRERIDRLRATLLLDESVSRIKGVSSSRASILGKMKIKTVRDLVGHYPRRYMDLSRICHIANAKIGESCTISGTIYEIKVKKPRRNLSIVEICLQDQSGTMIITVFNQPWLANKLKSGDRLAAAGKVEFNYGFKRMTNPYMEDIAGASVTGRVLPVHPATEKLSATWMRKLINEALDEIEGVFDPLPAALREKKPLMSKGRALRSIHFPATMAEATQARERLVYEEMLLLELYLIQQGARRCAGSRPVAHNTAGKYLKRLESAIPFELTDEQKSARDALLEVMGADAAANHMLLGDVGTGKTIVAAHGFAVAADSGKQSFLLAPTEVLATQHAETLGRLFDECGISYALLTGSTSKEERTQILARAASGELDVLIGTHAILEDDVVAKDLSFAVIDEQQRFGVDQRAKLLAKGCAPDALFLTATPIPRTLALALFGNLTLSYIKKKPFKGAYRTTEVLQRSQRGVAFDAAKEALSRGEQVYVVCPLVGAHTESQDGDDAADEDGFHPDIAIDFDETAIDENPVAAKAEASHLQSKVFCDYTVGLLYGSMPSEEKSDIMQRFKEGDIDVLVSTSVIEVGVDVANATVMIVEDADRFGLSQLHQLRGRVGRGSKAAKFFLVSASKRPEALTRLNALVKSDDGFELAEYDLALRREGDLLGNRQSGISTLKLVNIMKDKETIEEAHADAKAIIDADPELLRPEHRALKRELAALFPADSQTLGG